VATDETIVGRQVESKPKHDRCVTAVVHDGKFMLGCVVEGTRGFYPMPAYSTNSYADAELLAKARNDKLGITDKDAIEMVLRSMRKG
jgi:hypothetical protein